MKRPVASSAHVQFSRTRLRVGYTIVELLMATTLTLILMGVVATILKRVSQSVHETRATLEMTGRLRDTKEQLRRDLDGVTVPMFPPRRPEDGEGYLEIIEGPVGVVTPPDWVARNFDRPRPPDPTDPIPFDRDTTVGDFDDILMFTTHSPSGPFVGRYRSGTIESDEAEVIWFVRGRTLYRRVLLISPQTMSDMDIDNNGRVDLRDTGVMAFHAVYDISARPQLDPSASAPFDAFSDFDFGWIPNTLGDLTKRENRYAHAIHPTEVVPPFVAGLSVLGFPYRASRWGQLGLPTLRECSHPNWMTWLDRGSWPGGAVTTQPPPIDLWLRPHPWPEVDPVTGTMQFPPPPPPPPVAGPVPPCFMGPRVAEDVILTNVIGFDVKVWDPGAPVVLDDSGTTALLPGDPGYLAALVQGNTRVSYGAYVDLNYMCLLGPESNPSDPGAPEPSYRDVVQMTGEPEPHFYGAGRWRSGLRGTPPYSKDFTDPTDWPPPATWAPSVYDTWSLHYEHDGQNQDNDQVTDEGTNGFDDPVDPQGRHYLTPDAAMSVLPSGVVDEPAEMETSPPYPFPSRGIQIKIRTYEPDSRQVREVTVIQDFLPK